MIDILKATSTRMKKILLPLFCIHFFIGAFAQQHTDDSTYFSMSIDELMDIEVTTASLQAESTAKTPVPTTVITREMIDAIGAQHIKEILTTYVPGFTAVEDHNEMNVSTRGIYASAQQKILFMINGHRLNSRSYSMANPDFGINLDKVKQIEVVRGPGSSLYGNVSLTAVVNIITLKGEDLDGTRIKIAGGNYGQRYISTIAGTSLGEDSDILLWGHYYNALGEEYKMKYTADYSSNTTEDGVAYLGSAQGNYDIGVQASWGHFDFLFNTSRGKIQQPFSDGGGTGELYDRDDYDKVFGENTGLLQEMKRAKIGYSTSLNERLDFKAEVYGDDAHILAHLVVAPRTRKNSVVSWWDRDLGGIAQFTYRYPGGSILTGAQVDWMEVYDSFWATSTSGSGILTTFQDTTTLLLDAGQEVIYSAFTQARHQLSKSLLLNAGFRYDLKRRHEGENIKALSPRIALIYEVSPLHNIKFSYAKSFVDAPYWYRYNSLPSYAGSRDLKPENLQTFQLTVDSRLLKSKIYNSANVFYQTLNDFIFRDPEADNNEPRYRNAGTLTSWGLEEEVRTKLGDFDLTANATYQYAIEAKDYEVNGSDIANIPTFTSNIIGTYNISRHVMINAAFKYISSQFSPIVALGSDVSVPDHYTEAAIVINTGVRYANNNLAIDLRVRNVADKEYYQGGSTRFPYPQQGRWITGSLQYTFRN